MARDDQIEFEGVVSAEPGGEQPRRAPRETRPPPKAPDPPSSSAAIFSMTAMTESVPKPAPVSVLDDVEPVPPGPPPQVAPVSAAPPRTSRLDIPQAVLDDVAKDLEAEHPGSRWALRPDPMRLGLALFVEVKDRLTNEVVGQARGTVSLTPLYTGKQIDIASEAERMINSIPSPL